MNATITTHKLVAQLQAQVTERGATPGKAFRRHCNTLVTSAITEDLNTIRAEAMARKKPSWGDHNF